MHRKTGGAPSSGQEAAARLKTDTATGGSIDAATGMFKPVQQVGVTAAEEEGMVVAAEVGSHVAAPGTNGSGTNGRMAAHELVGSLAPVTQTPKPVAKRLNPLKLKQMEDRVVAIEEELPELEARMEQAEQQQGNYTTAEAARALAAELEELRERHASRTAEWEELSMQLEEQMTA